MYYVSFDEKNRINGFFNDEINSIIPESAIKITDEQWQELSENPEKYILENGEIVLAPETSISPPITYLLNWTEFNRKMRDSIAYQTFVSTASDKESVRRFETIAITFGAVNSQSEDLQDIQPLWNAIAFSVPDENKSISVFEEFNLIAQSAYMPFRFTEGVLMAKAVQ